MDDNLKKILKEFDKLKGQFVINIMMKVQRLVAVAEDEMDYYYITYDGRKLFWNTCVGRIIPLKGKIDKKHYDELERMASLNDYDRLISAKPNGVEYQGKTYTLDGFKSSLTKEFRPGIDKLLTDIIFTDNESKNN